MAWREDTGRHEGGSPTGRTAPGDRYPPTRGLRSAHRGLLRPLRPALPPDHRATVDLYEVRLADIVDAFLAEVELMQRLDLEVATEFLVIAATLVELKCRRLLPGRDDDVDPRSCSRCSRSGTTCSPRLVECTTFASAGGRLAELELAAARCSPAARRTGRALRRPCSPTCSARSRSTSCARRPSGRSRRGRPPRRGRPRPRRRGDGRPGRRGARARPPRAARRRPSAELTVVGPHPHGGRGPLPRAARALQAGPDRARAGDDLR